MPESATERRVRRTDTAVRITRCARRLTDARGYDGFTMEELAEEAGVSRRTLFNHVPGKLDAVLGPEAHVPADSLAVFLAGGPHGDLVLDLRELADAILTAEEVEPSDLAMLKRILLGDARLFAAVHERFSSLSGFIIEQVQLREGPAFGRVRARVAVGVLLALFDAALVALLEDPDDRPLVEHFDDAIALARDLFGAAAPPRHP